VKHGITALLGSEEQNGDETTSACIELKYKKWRRRSKILRSKMI